MNSLMLWYRLLVMLLVGLLAVGCVDAIEQDLLQHVNVVVVEGTLTNLTEPQVVYLNRSRSDSLTGRFGTLPLTGATVQFIVDSSQVIALQETDAGRYQAPAGFTGQVGHAYQLRFTLKDGTRYQSSTEIMPPVPAVQRVYARFNATSLTQGLLSNALYRAANDVYIDWQDPAEQHNYYRWDWRLWEQQPWCKTCVSGYYLIYDLTDQYLFEDCLTVRVTDQQGYFVNDYPCRSSCWAILRNRTTDVFDDRYTNGGLILSRRVAQIPYYQPAGCLVEIRQSSLTRQAYQYNRQVQQQSQITGGVADSPPTALVGNVQNVVDARESVVGYFTASAVSAPRLWISRTTNSGAYPGLFPALNGRQPSPENVSFDPNTGAVKPQTPIRSTRYARPPLAPCLEGDDSTPFQPTGWQN